jgi:hypothetical protein
MEEYNKGKGRMAENCEGVQGPAWAVGPQTMILCNPELGVLILGRVVTIQSGLPHGFPDYYCANSGMSYDCCLSFILLFSFIVIIVSSFIVRFYITSLVDIKIK